MLRTLIFSLLATSCLQVQAEDWTLKNGKRVSGNLIEDYGTVIVVQSDQGRRTTIARSQLIDQPVAGKAHRLTTPVALPPLNPQVGLLLRRLHERHQRLDVLLRAKRIDDKEYEAQLSKQVEVFVTRVRVIHPELSSDDLFDGLASLLNREQEATR